MSTLFSLTFCILAMPFFSVIPYCEPFVLGVSAIFHVLMPIFGIISVIKSFNKKIIFQISKSFLLLLFFLIFIFLNSYFKNKNYSYLTPLSLLAIIITVLLMMHKIEKIKIFFSKSTVFFSFLYIIFIFFLKQNFELLPLFGHSHFAGAWFLCIFPLIFYSFIHLKSFYFKIITGITLLTVAFYILLFSKSLIIPFIFIINLFIFFTFFSPKKKYIFIILGSLSFIMLILFTPKQIAMSLEDRLFIWKVIFKHINYIPFFGVGLGGFESFYLSVLNGYLMTYPKEFLGGVSIGVEWAHNEFIHSFIEFGYIGIIIILSLTVMVIMKIIYYYKNKDLNFIFYYGIINIILYSFVSFPFRMPFSGIVVFYLILLLFFEDNKSTIKGIFIPTLRNFNFIIYEVILIVFSGAIVLGCIENIGLYYLSKGIKDSEIKADKKNINPYYLKKSLKYYPDSKLTYYGLGNYYMKNEIFDEACYYFEKGAIISPSVPLIFGMTFCKDMLGKYEQAIDGYEKIKRIAPDFEIASHNLEVILKRQSMQ